MTRCLKLTDFDKVVSADFNINFSVGRRSASSSQNLLFKGITELHDLKQVIESLTRVTVNSDSPLIDLCRLPKLNNTLPSPTL